LRRVPPQLRAENFERFGTQSLTVRDDDTLPGSRAGSKVPITREIGFAGRNARAQDAAFPAFYDRIG